MTNKIDREDMLALTRRMNVARSSFTRIAGCYVDKDGDFDGSFNVNFLKLSAAEKKKNIELAKVVPFAATNVNMKRYEFADADRRPGTVWQLFVGVRVGAVPADAHLDRCVLGGVVDKPHDLFFHSNKRVLDHRIRLGEVGHKLVFIVDVRNIIRRLGPLYIKALSGELFKEQPVKICFAPQPAILLSYE